MHFQAHNGAASDLMLMLCPRSSVLYELLMLGAMLSCTTRRAFCMRSSTPAIRESARASASMADPPCIKIPLGRHQSVAGLRGQWVLRVRDTPISNVARGLVIRKDLITSRIPHRSLTAIALTSVHICLMVRIHTSPAANTEPQIQMMQEPEQPELQGPPSIFVASSASFQYMVCDIT